MGSRADWKEPFRDLKKVFRSFYDLNRSLYHTVLISPVIPEKDLGDVVDGLEASISGKQLVARIQVPTKNCEYHAHYFFGDSNCYAAIKASLKNLDYWLRAVPKGLLPQSRLPQLFSHDEHNVVLWTNLVYALSEKLDLGYLDDFIEYQFDPPNGTFLLWESLDKPNESNPGDVLLHHGKGDNDLAPLLAAFEKGGFEFPDVVDAYLFLGDEMTGDFVRSSMMALDGLLQMPDVEPTASLTKISSASSAHVKKRSQRKQVTADVTLLAHFLIVKHGQGKGRDPNKPLTWNEIDKGMGWNSPGNSKVSRRMARIFQKGGMQEYGDILGRSSASGLIRFLKGKLHGFGEGLLEPPSDSDEN